MPSPRPTDNLQPTASHRLIGWMLTFIIGFTLLAALVGLLTKLFGAGPIAVLIVVLVLFGIPLFHYIVWGWWLSRRLREEGDADEPPRV